MKSTSFVLLLSAYMLSCVIQLPLIAQSTGSRTQSARAVPNTANLDRLVQEKLYPKLQRELPAASLSVTERTYFEGIVADRTRDVPHAIVLLEKALPELKASNAHRAAMALRALADDYFEAGRYGDAASAYSELLGRFRGQFSPADLQEITDNLHTYELLRGASPQSVGGRRDFTVPTHRDPIGDVDVPLTVGNTEEWWIFDTGANISGITLSTARRLGLTVSTGHASTKSGATGAEVPLRTTVIPEVRFGGAVVRNVVALVTEDKALDIDLGNKRHYAIRGILGYPVLAALGSFTFSGDRLTVAAVGAPSSRCTNMFVEELMPLFAATANGREVLFSFDTGASSGSLTAKYLHEFPQQFASLKVTRIGAAGAGGARVVPAYHLPHLELHLGTAKAAFRDIPVLAEELGTGILDRVYGNLGQGLVGQFRSYTIDFSRMKLCVGDEARR